MRRISDEVQLERLLAPFSGADFVSARGRMNYSATGSGERGMFLLVAGLAMNRSEWSPELIDFLHRAGYATTTVDNRDFGYSELSGRHATPVLEAERGLVYGLNDLAADLRDLVAHLGYQRVHVVGMSMGGMIAQHLAILAPESVASLTSIMSTTGRRGVGRPHEDAKWIFTTPAPLDLDGYLDYARRHHESIAGPHYCDPQRAIDNARIAWRKGIRLEGTARQLAAIRADGDRSERLAGIRVPTLVIHGEVDPMIDISGGEATAEAIPHASFVRVPKMGHSIPWQLAGTLGEFIIEHAKTAEGERFAT